MRLFILHNDGPANPVWDFTPTDISLDDLFDHENIFVHLEKLDYEAACNRMKTVLEKYQNTDMTIYVYTGNYCDAAQAPCGCYGYDGQCEWHGFYRRYDDAPDFLHDFATCMCSDKYKTNCSYHIW
jgi:hypothetical protein